MEFSLRKKMKTLHFDHPKIVVCIHCLHKKYTKMFAKIILFCGLIVENVWLTFLSNPRKIPFDTNNIMRTYWIFVVEVTKLFADSTWFAVHNERINKYNRVHIYVGPM